MLNGTNSLINGLMGSSLQPVPTVGMGATRLLWTDRTPCTIIFVSAKSIMVQDDTATVVSGSGHDGSAEYSYAPNPNGGKSIFTLRNNGAWVAKGSSVKNGQRVLIGQREKYRDPTF